MFLVPNSKTYPYRIKQLKRNVRHSYIRFCSHCAPTNCVAPFFSLSSCDIFTCALYQVLVWVGEIAGCRRSPPATCSDRRLKNKGFLLVGGDRGDLVRDLIAGGHRRSAVTCDHIKD